MTIEIRQLIIRAVVDNAPAAGAGHEAIASATLPVPTSQADAADPVVDHQALVSACVREVMRRLDRARER